MRVTKGIYGYLSARRRQTIVLVIVLLIIVFGMYFGAYAYFGTNQNWFTIFAALICLPTAKIAVSMIMYLKASGCSSAAHEEIEQHLSDLPSAYELYMTTDKQNYALSHVTVGAGSVIALTEDPKCDTGSCQIHIRSMMQGNGYHGYTVKVFGSLNSYITRLDQLTELGADKDSKDDEVLQLLAQISL